MKLILCVIMGLLLSYQQVFAEDKIKDSNPDTTPTMKIYYHEFWTAPYGATTVDNIDELPDYEIWFYSKHPFIDKIQEILETKPSNARLIPNVIRLKVEINGTKKKVYFIDKEGHVSKSDGQYFILSNNELKKLHKDIVYFHAVVDKRPFPDPWPNVWMDVK